MSTDVSKQFADAIISTSRTTLGDSLRSVVYFTPDDFEVLYVRSDLYDDDDEMRAAKATLVENERAAVGPQEAYSSRSAEKSEQVPEYGEYEFTLRVFSDGFVGCVVSGGVGVIATTDELELSEFEEMEIAIQRMLEEEAKS
jgi:hypothetical protein